MFKKIFLISFGILIITIVFSGCSGKPNLKVWSKATATYLISQKFPQIINSQKRVSIFSSGPFGMPFPSGHKIINNFNIGKAKFKKIILCKSDKSTDMAACWCTVTFTPNNTYYKVKKELQKHHAIIHKTGEMAVLFRQTVNNKWYIADIHWNNPIVQYHYPY